MPDTAAESLGIPTTSAEWLAAISTFEDLPLIRIRPSAHNPRKRFDEDGIAELASSMRDHGLAQPILVRQREDMDCFEIVAGERRWRAATQLGWPTIPAIVRKLTEQQALELQVIENLQRADLHPLEEAEGYERLIGEHGYNVVDLATKIGKSREYVYGRLKLTALVPEARTAFYAGTLTPSTALLVARMTPAVQASAVSEVAAGDDGHPLSFRRAAELFRTRYMLDLRLAVFDVASTKLLPAAGACTDCPKRTGNQADLFADVSNSDTCTDPTCFNDKKAAHWTAERVKLEKKGITIVEGADAEKLMPFSQFGRTDMRDGAMTVTNLAADLAVETGLDDDAAKARIDEVAKAAKIKPHAIVKADGSIAMFYDPEAVGQISTKIIATQLSKAAKQETTEERRAREARDAEFKRETRKRQALYAYTRAIIDRTRASARVTAPTSLEMLRAIALALWIASDFDEGWQFTVSRGIEMPDEYSEEQLTAAVAAWIDAASADELACFLLDLAIDGADIAFDDRQGDVLQRLATAAGIDWSLLHKEYVDDVLDPSKKRSKAPKKKADQETAWPQFNEPAEATKSVAEEGA